jgi:hypothetical protein
MYKQLVFVASILLIACGVSAKETRGSGVAEEFAGIVSSSESVLSSKWMERFTVIKNDSTEENTISTCCFGCPKPTMIERKINHIFLPLDYVTKIVTKTKRKFSIVSKDGINYLYVPENSNNTWFNEI